MGEEREKEREKWRKKGRNGYQMTLRVLKSPGMIVSQLEAHQRALGPAGFQAARQGRPVAKAPIDRRRGVVATELTRL